ncbi:MAG: FAD-binding oxidoreductase [Phycisphaerales bacterium]|nr:MAG: FAD-binding oxidoreductase [Phycisphaerales bacterium]
MNLHVLKPNRTPPGQHEHDTGFDREESARSLAAAVEGDVRFGLHDRLLYATDASIYQVEPLGVVVPASLEDAVRAVRFCAGRGLPILPRGGGTSLAGQCVNRAVVLDLSSRCTSLVHLDEGKGTCRVEAGITIDDLNDRLAGTGLYFAPDPSTTRQATVAGCIGNNAAGMHSVLYGRTSESVLGIDACLATGERVVLEHGAALRDPNAARLTERVAEIVRAHAGLIRERFPKTKRRSAGYQLDVMLDQLEAGGGDLGEMNLAPLLCGSEGTLAVTLGAELKLHPVPRHKGMAVVSFAELDDAIAAVMPLLETRPAAIELLDDLIVDLARKNPQQKRNVEVLPKPEGGRAVRAVLYVEYFGMDEEEVAAALDRVREMFAPGQVDVHTDARTMAAAWALRKAGEPLLHAIPGSRKPLGFVEDNAVPPERLREFVRGFREIVSDAGTIASFYAHASVGVLHVRPLLDLRDPADEAKMHEIAERAAALAKSLGGVMSGEHGDGRARGPLVDDYFGPELVEAFRQVKAAFDPRHLLNPGNIVEPGPIESISANTRVRPGGRDARIPEAETYFDYSDQTDFAHAVEMCNGAGVCRKKTGGVMCPSYMGTLDERHSTRGRGNALRLAISGQMGLHDRDGSPRAKWDDPGTIETLDLCLSCKACKSECPSNVDIARLKAEYTAQRYRSTGRVPLRARVFGHVHTLNRLGSRTPGVANAMNGTGLAKWAARKLLGVDARRSIPSFAKSLRKQWPSEPAFALPADAPCVVLLVDTFTMHNEPSIGLAAKRLLEAFGYRVEPFWGTDFGRALISTGLLREAIDDADRLLDRLSPLIDDATVAGFVMLEPSCLSSVVDDWLLLKCRTPIERRRALASRSSMVERFLADRWEVAPRRPSFAPLAGDVVLHGHCHQKALWGADSSAKLLRLAFGESRVRSLDTTCCGMAGSFGYAAKRYELSMRIGELSLFPSVREAAKGDVIVAPGTSCRHQIADGTGRGAVHPVELLAGRIEPG